MSERALFGNTQAAFRIHGQSQLHVGSNQFSDSPLDLDVLTLNCCLYRSTVV
eukprot:COSAG02_NODE_7071_length_3200_cov_1.462109_4_plen_52_part_00